MTELDHENGFKVVPILFRSGKPATLRLVAPSHRLVDEIYGRCASGWDWAPALEACLDPDQVEALNRLTMATIHQLKAIAVELAFGITPGKQEESGADQDKSAGAGKRAEHPWRKCEMLLIRAGLAHAEVARFSLPKLARWIPAAREQVAHDALVQSLAVWEPKKLLEQMDSETRRDTSGAGTVSLTPKSQEEFEALMRASDQKP